MLCFTHSGKLLYWALYCTVINSWVVHNDIDTWQYHDFIQEIVPATFSTGSWGKSYFIFHTFREFFWWGTLTWIWRLEREINTLSKSLIVNASITFACIHPVFLKTREIFLRKTLHVGDDNETFGLFVLRKVSLSSPTWRVFLRKFHVY